MFPDVTVERGIVYRHTTNSHGAPVDLALDVYRPVGDPLTRRPAIMWMHGGYFAGGDRTQLRAYAQAFAQRGYDAVNIDYRTRRKILTDPAHDPGCIPSSGTCLDWAQFSAAMADAQDDARAAVGWLRAHATRYGIDPRAIAAGGWSAGAITSSNLAHPLRSPAPADSKIAAAVSMAGALFGSAIKTAPPTLAFGGNRDSILPFQLEVASCAAIREAGTSCDMVAYAAQRPPPSQDQCVLHAVPCTYGRWG